MKRIDKIKNLFEFMGNDFRQLNELRPWRVAYVVELIHIL